MRYWTPTVEALVPGEWVIFDGKERIAVVRKLERFGPHKSWTIYRSVTWAQRSEDRVLIGYFPTQEMAVWVTWQEWRKAHGRGVGPVAE